MLDNVNRHQHFDLNLDVTSIRIEYAVDCCILTHTIHCNAFVMSAAQLNASVNVTVTKVYANAAVVRWRERAHGGCAGGGEAAYELRVAPLLLAGGVVISERVAGACGKRTVTGLKPNTDYTVELVTSHSGGNSEGNSSDVSNDVHLRTLSGECTSVTPSNWGRCPVSVRPWRGPSEDAVGGVYVRDAVHLRTLSGDYKSVARSIWERCRVSVRPWRHPTEDAVRWVYVRDAVQLRTLSGECTSVTPSNWGRCPVQLRP